MAPHTIRLRDPWERQTDSPGELRLSRWFNSPTGIAVGDLVYLVVEGLAAAASVSLNEQALGQMTAHSPLFRVEISKLLRSRNRICLALAISEDSPQGSGLAPIVRLEIEGGASVC